MSSGSSSRRRLSDSQVYRDRANLLPDLEITDGSSVAAEHGGAFGGIGHQLELEGKLHELARQLLQSYRETQQWASVGQLAQVLVAGSQRVGQLKQQLEGLREKSGGLFLESIRERSLPRDTLEAEAANQSSPDQSLKKDDTVEAERLSAEGACKIPARQDSPESVGQFEQASEQRCHIHESASYRQVDQVAAEDSSVSTTAALSALPAAQASVEPEGANQNQEEAVEVGVKSAHQLESESVDSEFVFADCGEDCEDKNLAREGSLDEVLEESEQTAIYREEKGNTGLNSSSVCSTSAEIPPPSFEDATVDAPPVAIDTDTTAGHSDSKLEAEGAEEEIGNKETSQDIVPLTFESNKSQTSRSPLPTSNEYTELVGDFSRIVEQEVATASPSKPECDTCETELTEETTVVEVASSSEHSESESKSLLTLPPSTLPPAGCNTVGGQAPLNTDHQCTVDTGETLFSVLSPGETQSSTTDTDGLKATSASSIDREFGIVDECLEDFTSEIEALVIASEISSDTSEQFFSPPESITVEAEYDDAQQELEREETIKPADQERAFQENEGTIGPAVFVNLVVAVEEEVVEEEKEKPAILAEPVVVIQGQEEEKLAILAEPVVLVQGQEEEKPVILAEPVPSLLEEEEPVVPFNIVAVSEVIPQEGGEEPVVPAEPVVSLEEQEEENGIPAAQVEPAAVKVQEEVKEEEIEQKTTILAESVVVVQGQEEEKPAILAEPVPSLLREEEKEELVVSIVAVSEVIPQEGGEEPAVPAEPVVSLEEQEENVIPAAQAEPAAVKVQEQIRIEQKTTCLAEPVQQEQEKLADPVVVIPDQGEGKEVLVADQGEKLCEEQLQESSIVPVESVVTLKVVGDAVVKEKTTTGITSETEEEEPKEAEVQVGWDTILTPEAYEFTPTKEEEGGGETVLFLATETVLESVSTENQRRAEMEPLPKIGCPAVRYSVTRSAFSDVNTFGTALYIVNPVMDKNGDTRSAVCRPEMTIHSFEDFIELRRKLLSLDQLCDGEEKPRDIPELELDSVSKENGQMVDQNGLSDELHSAKEEKILEEFLNQIASNPQLHREPVVLNFLSPTPNKASSSTVVAASDDILNSISSQINGGEQQEPVVEEESNLVKSDRAVSVEETPPTEQGSLEKEVMSELSSASNSIDHTDAVCEGDALTVGGECLSNGVEHIDQSGQTGRSKEGHMSDQLNQLSEHQLDQLDQSDQQASLVKHENEVAHERDTNIVVRIDKDLVSLPQQASVEDSRGAPSSEQGDVLQMTPSTDTVNAKTTTLDHRSQKGKEVCTLPDEKSELFGGLASCDDLGVGKGQSPKPHKSTTMLPTCTNQEEETMKEWCPGESEGKDEAGISTTKNGRSVESLDSTALTGKVPPAEEEEMHIGVPDQQPTKSGEMSPVVVVAPGIGVPEEGIQVHDSSAHQREPVQPSEDIENDVLEDEVDSKKDASVVAPVEIPTVHGDASVEDEKGSSLSGTDRKAPLSSWEETKPVGTSVVSPPPNGDESDLSPTHSERTSSNATSSSYLYTTDESTSPLKVVGQKPPIHRVLSDPSLPMEEAMTESIEEESNTFDTGPVPSQVLPRPEGEAQDESGSGKPKKVKRKPSVPLRIRSSINTVKRSLSMKKRGMTIDTFTDSEGVRNVSIMKPLTTQEWDPTCLLEELYSDYRQGLAMSTNPSGEAARHCGYLDKLPTNRKKANVMTKWKRRYFRAQEGNLYYYLDRTTKRALGFIHLTSSRIDPMPDKMQLQIVPRDGKSIMIRTPNMDEFQTWHRAILLEAAHPTMVAPSSPKPAIENPTIIIDIGACSVRAGLVREDPYPVIFFPAVCSFDSESFDLIECGYAALLPDNRIKARQVYPRKASLRMDRHLADMDLPLKAMDAIINAIVMQLDIDPQACQLIMTLSPTAPEKERDGLVDLLFSTFGFSGICLQDQTLLALYSYNTTTGVIVDIGNHIAVVPYIDGYAIESGITRLPYGGNAITESLTKLVTQKGMRYFSETEMFINRFVKESLCYVSQDYEQDCALSEESTKDFIRVVDVDRFQLPDHRKIVTLDSALFKAPEGLFSPHLWGKDVPSLHEIVWKAIQACPIDHRRELSKKIYLSGGSGVLPGLKERLQKEISALAPSGVVIEIHVNDDGCHHAAYCGASVLASLGSFQNCLVNYEEWTTGGTEVLKKWSGL